MSDISDFAGVWKRTHLYEPKGELNLGENHRVVIWIQSRCGIFVDIRVDPEVKPSSSKSFAGTIISPLQRQLTWERIVDYRLQSALDIGGVRFTSENTLQEDGVLPGDDFTEIWERYPSDHSSTFAGELRGGDRRGYAVLVGEWFAVTVNRGSTLPDGITLDEVARSFDKPLVSDEIRNYLLQYVTVVGKCADWKVLYSVDPALIGENLMTSEHDQIKSLFSEFEWVVIEGSSPVLLRDRINKVAIEDPDSNALWWRESEILTERATLHSYSPSVGVWSAAPVLLRIDTKSFGKGVSRQANLVKYVFDDACADLPESGYCRWGNVPDHVLKSHISDDGDIRDSGLDAFESVLMQLEASFWADQFSRRIAPSHQSISVVWCAVLEITSRINQPFVSCEPILSENGGSEFRIYNSDTLAGPVGCASPHVLPYFLSSFYSSCGLMMVIHVEGLEKSFTNPLVHSFDCRFGSADCGRRGMAIFFASGLWNELCEQLHIPIFSLSMNEKHRNDKNRARAARLAAKGKDKKAKAASYVVSRSDSLSLQKKLASDSSLSSVVRLSSSEDLFKGISCCKSSSPLNSFEIIPEPLEEEEKHEVRQALKKAMDYARRVVRNAEKTKNEAISNSSFCCFSDYFRISEEIVFRDINPEFLKFCSSPTFHFEEDEIIGHATLAVYYLQSNVAEVHLELSMLEACGRFSSSSAVRFGSSAQCAGTGGRPDVSSSIFHIVEACCLGNCAAALALARLCYGLSSDISMLLSSHVAPDREAALDLFMLAAHRGSISSLFHAAEIWESLGSVENALFLYRIALSLMSNQKESKTRHDLAKAVIDETDSSASPSSASLFCVGDNVLADWGGSWYPARVLLIEVEEVTGVLVSYTIEYSDGGEQQVVLPHQVKEPELSPDPSDSPAARDEESIGLEKMFKKEEPSLEDKLSVDKQCNGLATALVRIGVGSDDDIGKSVVDILGTIGRLFQRLYEHHKIAPSGDGGRIVMMIDTKAKVEDIMDEDLYARPRFPRCATTSKMFERFKNLYCTSDLLVDEDVLHSRDALRKEGADVKIVDCPASTVLCNSFLVYAYRYYIEASEVALRSSGLNRLGQTYSDLADEVDSLAASINIS